ncbi:MAG: ornithine carbamoyltransferase, partial [Oscillospiraceae bacterium]|nr:ornithine carbamoyltransferase [Oscillospiraceae bacterium]
FSNFSAEELTEILDIAIDMKKDPAKYSDSLKGKKLYMLFEKTSTRTFLSFATAITELGGTYYNQLWRDSNFVLGETVSEVRYVCRNVDIIMARLVKNETVELFGDNVTVPFINGCDSTYHPCQILADMLTVIEKFGSLDADLMYIGAKNNVFNSLVEFFAKMKNGTLYGLTPLVNKTACGTDFYESAKATGFYKELDTSMSMDEAKSYAKKMQVIYTDTWVDMEFFNDPAYKSQKEETLANMLPYQINDSLLDGSDALVFHDMPIHAGFEISESVLKKHMETILDEAENRRHAEKAVLYYLLKKC